MDYSTKFQMQNINVWSGIIFCIRHRPSKAEPIVLFMRSNPKPRNYLAFVQSHRAVMVADPHDANAISAFLEF